MIYLDNAATTRIDPQVLEAMMPYLTGQYGNPGTLYKLGMQARKAVENARKQVADFIGAKPEQIIFTSGGTEANNLVFLGTADYLKDIGKPGIIASRYEHDSVIRSAYRLNVRHGFGVTYFYPDHEGHVNPSEVESKGFGDTGLISVMYVNNETGSENDIQEIANVCKKKGVLFHTDCVQAAGCYPIDVVEIGCDFLSISSHKIHGPKGVGALYVKDPTILSPLIVGGKSQEFGLRGGTENVAGIVGFGKACELAKQNLHTTQNHCSILKQLFYNHLIEDMANIGLPPDIVHINGEQIIKHGKTLNLRFDGVDAETLLLMLSTKGVCVSAGSACTSHESQPSHVLTAMGLSPDEARSSVRISFSKMNTQEEVRDAANIFAACLKVLLV